MLVLNTNETNENILGKISNRNLVSSYPDFDQILFMPNGLIVGQTQTSGKGSIYGIPFHMHNADIYQSQFNNGTLGTSTAIGALSGCGYSGALNTTREVYARFVSNFFFKGGEVVGKNIIGQCFLGSSASSSQTTGDLSGYIKIYLVHSDGTMTLIGNKDDLSWTSLGASTYNSGSVNYYFDKMRDFSLTSAGFTAQEGDVLMVELKLKKDTAGSGTANTVLSMDFGYSGGGSGIYEIARPIQISIE